MGIFAQSQPARTAWAIQRGPGVLPVKNRTDPQPRFERKLADLYALNGLILDAGGIYQQILDADPGAVTGVRVGWKWAWTLDSTGEQERAAGVLADLRAKWGEHPVGGWLDQKRAIPIE